ncbi:uncharacterized protein K02A2.6-like [Culex pipiens pallens]|uniref:uncharacterized protein K02A2.6-like n=1 Tax=Culex pipiens pallens TaxID=42434 RepID=UPI001953BE79|nr:uncharacterized protein K02A2.6-like [Culex pipiens pallens]
MTDPDLKNAILRLTDILAKQQETLERLQNPGHPAGGTERIVESLASGIQEFQYDPDAGVFFDGWYGRYEDVFTKDGKDLDDPARVRLLLRKLSTPVHEKYTNTVLPNHPRDFTLAQTVAKLKKLFGRQKSVFHARYQCLQYAKNDADDFTTYAATVNKHCEAFQLSKLSSDQFKALRFVCGLQSPRDADIRARLISKLEADETAAVEAAAAGAAAGDAGAAGVAARSRVTLENLVEECHRVANLKQDTLMVENKDARNVNIVSRNQKKPASQGKPKTPKTPCWKCGDNHYVRECPFASHTCSRCKQQGHKEGYCSNNKPTTSKQTKPKENVRSKGIFTVCNIGSKRKFVPVELNGTAVKLQHDSASDITIISQETWTSIGQPAARPTDESAVTASGSSLNLLAEFQTEITIGSVTKRGRIFISDSAELNVLGIETMDLFDLWSIPINNLVNAVHQRPDQVIEQLKQQFPEVFRSTLGRCTKAQVKLYLKPDARPTYCPKRPVAYAALPKVDAELQRLQDNGIISPVQFSDWAAPIVVVRKADNVSVRICGDYSTGLNNALESDRHPLPHPDDLFAELAGAHFFTHLDLSDAYLQVEVEEESRKLLTVNTHRGLFQYNRLPPGVKPAPGAFQRITNSMVAGIPGVKTYLDDILIAGRTREDHDRSLRAVLERVREYGFHLRIEKCRFALPQIKFLGHIVDKDGIRPDPSKTEAIAQMQPPKDVQQLRSYLGAINYYGRFVKQMKQLRAPLDNLLKKDAPWRWSAECQKSFEQFKAILLSDLLLTHYDPSKEIVVAADASKYGLGAVIMHRFPSGEVKAIAHASRSLTPAEMNYGQVEKEALALVFAVTRFHKMLYGRHFLLQTDHQPLLKVFGSKKGIPVYTANRLQRWALTFLLYDFDIQHVSTTAFGYADFLSRLMSSQSRPDEDYVIAAVYVESEARAILDDSISNLPVTHKMIVAETRKDPVLQQVVSFLNEGWPASAKLIADPDVRKFFARRDGLQVVDDCVMFGDRIVVPLKFRKRIIRQLHRGHPGMDRMKSLARSYVYWPNVDDDVVQFVRQCKPCAAAAKSPTKATLESWPLPDRPWQRVHIDYAGPVDGYYYFVIVDAYSKWPEIFRTRAITATATLDMLRETCSRYGNPDVLVSDNGTQFTSGQFEEFCRANGVTHLRTAPYHPQSNGQAERFVDSLKRGLKKLSEGEGSPTLEHLQTFLSVYRSTPNRNTPNMTSPAEAFLGRPVRTTLDLLKKPVPATPVAVNHKQNEQFNRRHGAVKREFKDDDLVYAEYHQRNTKSWIPGRVVERKGSVNYIVQLDLEGRQRIVSSHVNQLRPRYDAEVPDHVQQRLPWEILIEEARPLLLADQEEPEAPIEIDIPVPDSPAPPALPGTEDPLEGGSGTNHFVLPEEDAVPADKPVTPPKPPTPVLPVGPRRPIRPSRIPRWLNLYDIS